MSSTGFDVHVSSGRIGQVQQVNDNVYKAEAVSPTGERMFLAMESMGDDRKKWNMYRNAASYLVYGGNECFGTIGSFVEIGSRVKDEMELSTFLSSRSFPDYWTSDEIIFNQLRDKLRKRKIVKGSLKAQALSVIPHASNGVNVGEQTHIVYASKSQVFGRISFSASKDKRGFDSYVDMYGDLIMCVGVRIGGVVENRGIFRNPLSVVEGGYGGISMMLHSFTCMVVQENFPLLKSFRVRPLKRMAEIFLESLPKGKITVEGVPGDEYDEGFEDEKDVRVPIEVLAKLYCAR